MLGAQLAGMVKAEMRPVRRARYGAYGRYLPLSRDSLEHRLGLTRSRSTDAA